MNIANREDIIKLLPYMSDLMDVNTLYAIEQALGFELTPAQISLITTDEMRYTGRTTAEAIRDYLISLRDNKPVEYQAYSAAGMNEARYKSYTIQRLMDAGLPEVKIDIRPRLQYSDIGIVNQ